VNRAVLIAGAMIALAVLAEHAWPQSSSGPNVNPLTTAWVVTACGTLPSGVTLTANTQGFVTVNTSGSLCVNQ
jgi:hypothetical protein